MLKNIIGKIFPIKKKKKRDHTTAIFYQKTEDLLYFRV